MKNKQRPLAVKEKNLAAVLLGQLGGRAIAKRGPAYFRKLSAMRKTRAGGRPRKIAQ